MKVLNRAPQLVSFVSLLLVWELAAIIFDPRWLPRVSEVAVSGWNLLLSGRLVILSSTAQTFAIGIVITFVAAGVIALVLAASELMEDAAEPFVNAALATPTVALIPVYILIWGFGDTTRVATVISFALFPVVVTWVEALRQAPANLLEMANAFTASPLRQLRSVTLPSAAPLLVTGVRIGAVQGVKGVVSAEVLIGVIGIGQLLQESTYILPQLYAIVSILILLSIALYLVLSGVESRASRRTQAG